MTDLGQQLVFIDSKVNDYAFFEDHLVSRSLVHLIDPGSDGINQVTQILKQHAGDVSGIHFITHGDSGSIQLGTSTINVHSLNNRFEFQSWKSALVEDADILFYGCKVGAGNSGRDFITHFSQLTDADVAASTNLTGSSTLGGDWDLEFATGQIETPLAFKNLSDYNKVLHGGATILVQAEDASHVTLSTYRPEIKSGVSLISLGGGANNETGTATYTFDGLAGSYDIIVGYYDENDGTASMLARIGDSLTSLTQIDSWVLGQNLGSAGVSPQNLVRRTIAAGRTLNPGTVIQLQGKENAEEFARIDYLEFVPTESAPPPSNAIRINAGGPTQNVSGVSWSDSTGFVSGGIAYTQLPLPTISGVVSPANESIYQTEWTGGGAAGSTAFTYNVPVSNGTYNVRLHFAELNKFAPGTRVFDVNLEGGPKELTNFDIFAQAGGAYKAIVRDFATTISDGNVTIDFISQVENAKISAIEILPVDTLPPNPGTLAFSAPTYSVNENGAPISVVQVTRTGGSSGAVSATVTPTNGTAIAPDDYNNSQVVVNFADGDNTAKIVTIPVVNDTAIEGNETINLSLGSPIGGATIGSQNTSVLTIVDNDGSLSTIRVEAEDPSKVQLATYRPETKSGVTLIGLGGGSINETGTATHTFNGPAGSYDIIVGYYDENDGTATMLARIGESLTTLIQVDSWVLGQNLGSAGVSPQNLVRRTIATGRTLNTGTVIQLQGKENAEEFARIDYLEFVPTGSAPPPNPGTLAFSAPTYSVNENGAPISVVQVTRTGGSSGAVSATVTPTNGTAIAPDDYNNSQVVVNFADGDNTAKIVTIPVVNDTAIEGNETINLSLGSPIGGATLGSQNTSVLTILDNDSSLSTIAWANVATIPIAVSETQGTVAGGKLYQFGGFFNNFDQTTKKSHVYDPVTNQWTQIADMPMLVGVTHAPVVADGQTIYLLGGYEGGSPGPSTDKVWKYSITNNTWTAGISLPKKIGGGAAVILGRELHFFGGATRTTADNDTDQNDHWVLNLDSGTTWIRQINNFPNPRNHLGATVADGKIYAIGGQHSTQEGTGNQSEVNVYDPLTRSWTRVADLPYARGHISASTFFENGLIYVIGGSANNGGNGRSLNDVAVYNPQTNVWSSLTPLPQALKTPLAQSIDGKLVSTTGSFSTNTYIGTVI